MIVQLRIILGVAFTCAVSAAQAQPIQGPVTGIVVLEDGKQDRVVVRLMCASSGIHGGQKAGESIKAVDSGRKFTIPWTYRGLFPTGCWLSVFHPHYVTGFLQLKKGDFQQEVGDISLTSWQTFLAKGPPDPPAHSSYPWPVMEIREHLKTLLYYYIPAFGEGEERRSLARLVPGLHRIIDGVVATGAYGPTPTLNSRTPIPIKELQAIEDAVEFPGAQRKLMQTIQQNDVMSLREILKAGAFLNMRASKGRAYLYSAAQIGATESVIVLLEAGAEVDFVPHPSHQTILATALFKRHTKTAAALIAHGASIKSDGIRLEWLASALCDASNQGDIASLRIFLAAGMPPDQAPSNGHTPLMCAAQFNQLQAAKMLITAGADVNAKASHNRSALRYAKANRNVEIIALLESHGANE